MKPFRFRYIAGVLLGLLALASCEEDQTLITDNPSATNYISLRSPLNRQEAASIDESALVEDADGGSATVNNSHEIQVYRSSFDIDDAVTVTLEINAQYLDSTDFFDAGERAFDAFILPSTATETTNADGQQAFTDQVTIPAGQVSTRYVITTIQDDQSSGRKEMTLALTSASDSKYKLGNPVVGATDTYVITVEDDDCPINLVDDWEGDWELVDLCAAPGSGNDGFCVSLVAGHIVTLSSTDPSNPGNTRATFSSAAGEPAYFSDVLINFNTCPQTMAILGTFELGFTQNGFPATIFPPDEPDTFGTGTFSPDGSSFNVVVSYGNTDGANFDEFILNFRPVE